MTEQEKAVGQPDITRPTAGRRPSSSSSKSKSSSKSGFGPFFWPLWSASLLAVSFIGLSDAIPPARYDHAIHASGGETTATVVRVEKGFTGSGTRIHVSRPYWYPVFETTIDGRTRVTDNPRYHTRSEDDWAVGQRIDVLYDTDRPEEAIPDIPGITEELDDRIRAIVGMQALTVVGIVGPLLHLWYRRRHPKPPKPPKPAKPVRYIKRHRARTPLEQAAFERREEKRAALRAARLARQGTDEEWRAERERRFRDRASRR